VDTFTPSFTTDGFVALLNIQMQDFKSGKWKKKKKDTKTCQDNSSFFQVMCFELSALVDLFILDAHCSVTCLKGRMLLGGHP